MDLFDGSLELPAVQLRGGWLAPGSVKRYAKKGKLQRQVNLLSQSQLERATSLRRTLPGKLLKAWKLR